MRDSNPSWQKILAQGFSSAAELLSFLQLPNDLANSCAEQAFKTRVPRSFVERMKTGDPRDPLLLQVLATNEELQISSDYSEDPLDEINSNPIEGLIHKYHGRVLLTFTGTCAINCRYCFRRHFPYQENNPGREGWQKALDYIASDAHIHEIILSGGDPLLASDRALSEFILQLDSISHVKTLRFHTRIPIVLPERINSAFMTLLTASRLNKVIVLHSNHPQELNHAVHDACNRLRQAGVHLLNQSVLLKGINNDAAVLAQLSERLFEFGVLPYYLHLLDKVQGSAHFDIPFIEAQEIFQQLQASLPGYLVPRLAREEAGQKSKTIYS